MTPPSPQRLPSTLHGDVLCSHYGAVALWVGRPDKRLMGWSHAHVDGLHAALDALERHRKELGLR